MHGGSQRDIYYLKTLYEIFKTDMAKKMFPFFIEPFCELNSEPMFSCAVPQFVDVSTSPENIVINQPFTMSEITAAIKLLKNSNACGVDNIINEFFEHNDCTVLIVDFFNQYSIKHRICTNNMVYRYNWSFIQEQRFSWWP